MVSARRQILPAHERTQTCPIPLSVANQFAAIRLLDGFSGDGSSSVRPIGVDNFPDFCRCDVSSPEIHHCAIWRGCDEVGSREFLRQAFHCNSPPFVAFMHEYDKRRFWTPPLVVSKASRGLSDNVGSMSANPHQNEIEADGIQVGACGFAPFDQLLRSGHAEAQTLMADGRGFTDHPPSRSEDAAFNGNDLAARLLRFFRPYEF